MVSFLDTLWANEILRVFVVLAALVLLPALSLNIRYCRCLALYRREVERLEVQLYNKTGQEIIKEVNNQLQPSENSTDSLNARTIKTRRQLLGIFQRYSKAAEQLDVVPVSALLDNALSRERIKILGISFSLPQAAFFLRSAPNFLIAIGLLGTFIGITLNLRNLGEILPQVDGFSDSSSVVQNLQRPLSAMALAFYSSLIGLACSLVLTLVTYWRSPIVERQRLLAALESFIDTIYSPVFAGETRLDKAVDRLTIQFEKFLDNFSTAVRDTLKEAFEDRLDTFFNISSGLLSQAEALQRQASNASTTLLAAATRFEEASIVFDSSTFGELLDSATVRLEKSEAVLSASARELANQFSTVGGGLERALNQIEQTTGAIKATTQASNDLAQSGHNLLSEIRPVSKEFKKTTQSFSQTQQRLVELTKGIGTLSTQQLASIQKVGEVATQIDQQAMLTSEKLTHQGDKLVERFSNLSQDLDERATKMSQILISHGQEIARGFFSLQEQLDGTAQHNQAFLDRLQREVTDRLALMLQTIQSTNQTLSDSSQKLSSHIDQNEIARSQWSELINNIQAYLESASSITHQLEETKARNSQALLALQSEIERLSSIFSAIDSKQAATISQINQQVSSILQQLNAR